MGLGKLDTGHLVELAGRKPVREETRKASIVCCAKIARTGLMKARSSGDCNREGLSEVTKDTGARAAAARAAVINRRSAIRIRTHQHQLSRLSLSSHSLSLQLHPG